MAIRILKKCEVLKKEGDYPLWQEEYQKIQ